MDNVLKSVALVDGEDGSKRSRAYRLNGKEKKKV